MNKSGNKSAKSDMAAKRKASNAARKKDRLAVELRANLRKRKVGPKSGKDGGGQ